MLHPTERPRTRAKQKPVLYPSSPKASKAPQSLLHNSLNPRSDIEDTIFGVSDTQLTINTNIVNSRLKRRELKPAHDVSQRQVDLRVSEAIILLAWHAWILFIPLQKILLVCSSGSRKISCNLGNRASTYLIPRHCLLPLVNETMKRLRYSPLSAARIHLSGLNSCGFGKSVGSMWTK